MDRRSFFQSSFALGFGFTPQALMAGHSASGADTHRSTDVSVLVERMLAEQWFIAVDPIDVQTVLSLPGSAFSSTGVAAGRQRGAQATEFAIAQAQAAGWLIDNARSILAILTAPENLNMDDYDSFITRLAVSAPRCEVCIVGAVLDPATTEDLRITLIATGC